MWVMYGSGLECICKLNIQEKPINISQAGLKVRASQLRDEGIKVAYHNHIHFEIQGECSVKQGKGDFAIQDIKISTNNDEADELDAGDNYFQVENGDLSKFGMQTIIWSTSRRLQEEDNLYRFSRLATHRWFDDRLLRIAKSFNLSEKDVFKMRDIFESMIHGRNTDRVKFTEFFAKIGFEYGQIAKWVVEAIHCASTKEMSFSEYVHLNCFYVMFSAKNLLRFLFQAIDVDNKGYLRRDQFNDLMNILAENSPFNVKVWQFQYEDFYDHKLGFMFVPQLESFLHKNPGALWQPQQLQRKMIKNCLGENYWNNKMEQFRIIREELGIKLLA